MRRRTGIFLLYTPGIALLVAGVAVLLTVPIIQHQSCPCSPAGGGVCSCPNEGASYNLAGPVLLVASALYSSSVYIVLRIASGWFKDWPRPLQ